MNFRIQPLLFNFCAFLFIMAGLSSCSSSGTKENTGTLSCSDFTVKDFSPVANWQADSTKHKTIFLDYTKAVEGFIVPSAQQIKEGVFFLNFQIKNTSKEKKRFYYKIFYQNESYKFPEYDSVNNREHEFSEENFYGSWEDLSMGFKKTEEIAVDNEFHTVQDYFRIVGNPRGEDRYSENGQNNRWKRNLRVGEYSFLLVVATKEELDKIPEHIQFINKKNGEHFSHPYVYFLNGQNNENANLICSKKDNYLKITAQPNLGAGIYIDKYMFGEEVNTENFCKSCGRDQNLFENAPVQQFVNYVDESTKMYNIPVIEDVIKDNYSKLDYNWNKKFYKKEELIPTYIQTAKKRPCSTVYSDSVNKKIVLKNPKTTFGEWKKESVGIITRHGLTYGKYRVKVKLTELVNKDGVWNGLTNAIWLITQGGGKWNYRRTCNKEGFMETYWGGRDDKRVPQVDYSEIDFEILKTPPYCPDNAFPPVYKNASDNQKNINSWNVPFPQEIAGNDDNITVACTNWDMACWEPSNFGVGCNSVAYQGNTYYAHRWDHWYRALTEKSEQSDNELFQSDFYYFEIDWRPTEIIWRIGKDPKNMKTVGYMNDQITSIPNNQMLMIITQEYHNTKWWPGTPYSQDNIPFPKNDIYGEILDLTIE